MIAASMSIDEMIKFAISNCEYWENPGDPADPEYMKRVEETIGDVGKSSAKAGRAITKYRNSVT